MEKPLVFSGGAFTNTSEREFLWDDPNEPRPWTLNLGPLPHSSPSTYVAMKRGPNSHPRGLLRIVIGKYWAILDLAAHSIVISNTQATIDEKEIAMQASWKAGELISLTTLGGGDLLSEPFEAPAYPLADPRCPPEAPTSPSNPPDADGE